MSTLFYVLGVLLLLLAPLLPGLLELYQKTDIAALGIDRLHTGNANVFAANYRSRVTALNSDLASKDWNARFTELQSEIRPTVTEEILAQGSLRIPAGFNCLQEVYCHGDVSTGMGVVLRSVLADGELNLGEDSSILRWAGAPRINVAAGGALFGRVVAEQMLCIDGPVSFQRIQAPTILLGREGQMAARPSSAPAQGQEVDICSLPNILFYNAAMRRVVVAGDFTLPEHSLLRGNLVVRGHLHIGDGCYIDGSIKAAGMVYLGSKVTITGSVISDQSVFCQGDCRIAGPIVADRQLSIAAGSVLGKPDAPSSLSAQFVMLKLPLVVHGTVWARTRGKVLSL